ncbi:hypothetical protein, partial [Cysteiniphilum sp. 6C5]
MASLEEILNKNKPKAKEKKLSRPKLNVANNYRPYDVENIAIKDNTKDQNYEENDADVDNTLGTNEVHTDNKLGTNEVHTDNKLGT